MSSMRNAVQRRNHKERAQPVERSKWGILEKHKDYSLRAKDYNAKQKRLKILRQKAADRNPDEFHFAMMSSSTEKGVRRVQDQQARRLDQDTVKLLKTQDAAYLRTVLQSTRKTRNALEQELMQREASQADGDNLIVSEDESPAKRHFKFIEDPTGVTQHRRMTKTEIRQLAEPKNSFIVSRTGGATEQKVLNASEILRKTSGRGTVPMEDDEDDANLKPPSLSSRLDVDGVEQRDRSLQALRLRLKAFKKREEALALAEQELELQRGRMQNSIGSVNKNGVKFKIRGRKT